MEELHVQIIVFDNEYPFSHHLILAPPPAIGAERQVILGAQPLIKSITRDRLPGLLPPRIWATCYLCFKEA
jgi:hypothetical protein